MLFERTTKSVKGIIAAFIRDFRKAFIGFKYKTFCIFGSYTAKIASERYF